MKLEQELVILGFLKEKPCHGYEIKKQIHEFLTYFAGLEYESIYYTLRSLEKKGLLRKETAASDKKRPDRYIYSLTAKGEDRFDILLSRSFVNINPPNFSLDVSLYFLPHLDKKVAKHKLKARFRILKIIQKNILNIQPEFSSKKPFHVRMILEHNLQLIKSEISFIGDLLERLDREER